MHGLRDVDVGIHDGFLGGPRRIGPRPSSLFGGGPRLYGNLDSAVAIAQVLVRAAIVRPPTAATHLSWATATLATTEEAQPIWRPGEPDAQAPILVASNPSMALIDVAVLVHIGAERVNIGLARVRVEVPMFGRDVADAHLCTVLQPSP